MKAEGGGFEPPKRSYRLTVFETAAFSRSATLPYVMIRYIDLDLCGIITDINCCV